MAAVLLILAGCVRSEITLSPSSADVFYLSTSEIKNLKEKSKQGDIEAAERLAEYYSIVEGDFNKANEFLRIPSKLGDERLQYSLALHLMKSPSSKDRKEGIYWFEQSANQGYIRSQIQLASLYEEGKLVDRNYCKAKYWYEKSARSGDVHSMEKMSAFYKEGKCVNRDNIITYAWLLVSKKHANKGSSQEKRINKEIAICEIQLSEFEKKQAKNEYEKLIEEMETSEDK